MPAEIPAKYSPSESESKWYAYWQNHGFFKSVPDDREPYTIVIPPPNVTGVLHMGHMLNNTIQDVLVRKARMEGKNALWVPGTDHASIATEAKVVAKLKEEGIEKSDITRDEFLEHAWEWTHKHGGIILEQLKMLGASCDWDRTRFTLEPKLSEQVIKAFVDLYRKGLIYRGVRMVNWDPSAKTALSDEEVIRKDVQGGLYFVRYTIKGSDETLTIATTRPETILGDTAICIHPEDERYTHLHGKQAIVPLVNRPIPIILDSYVDREFGTGCLKVTPAHDINDYELGIKHNLDSIDIFNEDGTINAHGGVFEGLSREDARKEVVKTLQEVGLWVKTDQITHNVGFSERSHAAIEPRLSLQWFLKMDDLAKPALKHVMDDTVCFYPNKFKNAYRHWMENIRDWCISRQLWWGHQIPVYYFGSGVNDYVVGTDKDALLREAQEKSGKRDLVWEDLSQDSDVLDTWFSSWLWPISVFDGITHPANDDIQYYYPTNDLVTAPEIMFFWVARMIMAGYENRSNPPFRNVYYTGIVRDKMGRKMSKSLGNSPDPIALMKKHGADGVRVGMLLSSPAGNDLLFDVSLVEQGRNFANKIWNAFRLVKMWDVDDSQPIHPNQKRALVWFNSQFNDALIRIEKYFSEFRISDALMATYKLVWDDFCSWYLEMMKPEYKQPTSAEAVKEVEYHFEQVLKILHPFMPFITEEIWQRLRQRGETESVMMASWPVKQRPDPGILAEFAVASQVITQLRKIRKEKKIPNKEAIPMLVYNHHMMEKSFDGIIARLCNLENIQYVQEKPAQAFGFVVKSNEYFIPFGARVDMEDEKMKMETELEYTQGFLKSVEKKLSNTRFVENAPPQVVEKEMRKKADAEQKIEILTKKLAQFNKG
jgi:valyl-tRNA synthetase